MAPMRNSPNLSSSRRRSSLSLLSTRRRSFAPKNYTFAPNVTPISYPSDPASPSSNTRSSSSPNPDGADADIKETDELAALAAATVSTSAPSRPRRRGGRKESVDHIPRPPNAFMLFRQNFVHQRHVPGSIETNHNSLSKIVGNCWKSLPSKDKKIWEALAEKKKEEHKRQYPDYRFQPKHDPEKKRKRQAARAAAEKAERERLMREQGELTGDSSLIPEESDEDNLQLQNLEREQEKERAMATRRQQVRTAHNHLGHRRSSSVPLPSETYPGYPYNNFGGAYAQSGPNADPFNFANPALGQAQPPLPNASSSSNGIALPSLPLSIGGLASSWYVPNSPGTSDEMGSAALANSEQANGQLSLPPHLHAPQPQSVTLSRGGSPGIPMSAAGMGSISGGFGRFSGMSSMGMGAGINTMGMGPRASRQYHLGQLGRRASSTQPVLQHQLASGAFSNYHYGAPSSFPYPGTTFGQHPAQGFTQGISGPFDFGANQHQQQSGFDGFVGAVAEGFTNPFASSAQSANTLDGSPTASNSNSVPASASGSYPAPLAPHAMWYEVDSVDPMTPVQPQPQAQFAQVSASAPGLPQVDTGLLNPSFNFGSTSENVSGASGSGSRLDVPPSPKSASASAPHSAIQAHFGSMSAPVHGSNSAPGTGMRDSFDFSAFNTFLAQLPGQTQNHNQGQNQAQLQEQQSFESVPPNSMPTNATGFTLAQPVPVRKVDLHCVPETHAAAPFYHEQAYPEHSSYQEQYVPEQAHSYPQEQVAGFHEHAQYAASQQSSSVSSGSSANASPSSGFVSMTSQHQQQQQHEVEIVSSHELLDGPVDVTAVSSAHSSSIPQQAQMQAEGTCAPGVDALDFGYEFNGVGSLETQSMYQMPMGLDADMGMGYDSYARAAQSAQAHDGDASNGNHGHGVGPRFSFSDFVHGSPYLSTSAVAN